MPGSRAAAGHGARRGAAGCRLASPRARVARPLALALLVGLGALAAAPARVGAHALSPALLGLRETTPGTFAVTWKIPTLRLIGAELRPVLPPACAATGPPTIDETTESLTSHWTADCGTTGLVGATLGVDGLGGAKTDALLHLELADGRTIDTVLRARDPTFIVSERDTALDVARRYVGLGVDHILTGYDHLLFVFGLLLLATDWRRLVATITAFTLGHSVTLTLAVLDVARVPPAPVEVLIAFSIFVLAVELARPRSRADADRLDGGAGGATRMRRRPWLMALAFGFLHGLGFAGTLRAAGLPADAVPLALLGFNAGIELGQLAFVLTVLALRALTRPVVARLPAWADAVPIYAMGSLAACWMIERARLLLA
ncbi:MAG: HupE/UreJ family protein [Deltaproteobacteria bacterium]|nr:HupE/UreJ family protein [Deltaproteobacteria bacterium]